MEARVKAPIHSNIKLFISVPGEKTVMHEVKSSSQPVVSIDVTPSRAKWNRLSHFSNLTSFTITVKTSHASLLTAQSTSVLFLLSRDKIFDKSLRKQVMASSKKALSTRSLRDHVIRRRQTSNACLKKKLTVNLRYIDIFNRYLVHPFIVDVGRCEGGCPADDVIKSNSSQRGIMLSLYQTALGMANPLATCVPQKMIPLSILHWEDSEVKIRYVDDIIIQTCFCE